MAGESILIVDDNALNLKLARVVLQLEGYEIHTAVDADSALAVLDAHHPRLILMDVQLPGIDGLQLTRQLKADPARRHIVIVALTASAMLGDEDKALAAGCDGYVTKPISPDALARTVAAFLAR